jgi:UDP-N-acetylmuramoyl-L-alanyl-D-glutamate--2,6-diaminopimelate ligase
VSSAVERGAAAIVAEGRVPHDVPQIVVPNARRALGIISHQVYREPTLELQLVGITGTNGKTTTAWVLETTLTDCGRRVARLGTAGARFGEVSSASSFTTPEADELARFLRNAADHGADTAVMEVSSHGLALERVRGSSFSVGAFLNLSQDHLDFHGTMERYAEAKSRLFYDHDTAHSVINIDDEMGPVLANKLRNAGRRVWTCSASGADADVRFVDMRYSVAGLRGRVVTPAGEGEVQAPLVGRHNGENACIALGCGLALGEKLDDLLNGLAVAQGAPGRLELVAHDPFAVFVDYAHTPDALLRSIQGVRRLTAGRVIVVFGCGGDRDRSKRPLMGEIAQRESDVVVVTSDNPRTEAPMAIAQGIMAGMRGDPIALKDLHSARDAWGIELDREQAIGLAIGAAEPGDCVLIAGKGHEDYQIIGTERRAFDDCEVARRHLGGA